MWPRRSTGMEGYERQGERQLCGATLLSSYSSTQRRNVRFDALNKRNTTQPFSTAETRKFSSHHRPVHCFSRPTPIQAYKLLAGQFGCFGCLSLSTCRRASYRLLTAAKTLLDSYPNDLATHLMTSYVILPWKRRWTRKHQHWAIFGLPFVKRFVLCYRTVVCPVCL